MKTTETFIIDLGWIKRVEVEYEYTHPVKADAYCGHDAPDREGEPGEVTITAVMVPDGDALNLLENADMWLKEIQDRAEYHAARLVVGAA